MEYHAAAKSAKPPVAVLSGPTRSFASWASVRLGKLQRSARRYVILRSSRLLVCATDNPRSQLLALRVTGGSMASTGARYEVLVRAGGERVWIQWASEAELRVCRAAFEFANRRVEDYYKLVTHRQLGKGRSSEVVFAFDTATGDHAAVKVMNKDKARATDREFAEKEVIMRMTIQHPCIVQTLDIFESPFDLFVVMELMGGGPLDRRLMKQNAPLREPEARVIMHRLFVALAHLHSRDIAHRNVKPQNLFLDFADDSHWADTAKLSDFSLACFVDDPDSSKQVVGTPEYLAPEASIMATTQYGERGVVFGTEVDMWAAGVTLYNILSMELPYEGDYPPDVFKKARQGKVHFSKRGFSHISTEAISLIRSLLNVDRRKRLTAETVMLHQWFAPSRAQEHSDALSRDTNALTLTHHLLARSEGLWRLRSAVLCLQFVHRLAKRTPGLQLRAPIRLEKRFHFNVSGIDIAPRKPEFADPKPEPQAAKLRTSTTVMSRVSTGSTVKSRSSVGGDSVVGAQRSDNRGDYFTRQDSRVERHTSFGSGSMGGVHRMISEKMAHVRGGEGEDRAWPWRRRGGRESRAPVARPLAEQQGR